MSRSSLPRPVLVNSFCQPSLPKASGNKHQLFFLSQDTAQSKVNHLAANYREALLARSTQESNIIIALWRCDDSQRVCARFFQCGHEIRRCGSGVLAVAGWLDNRKALEGDLVLYSKGDTWRLAREPKHAYSAFSLYSYMATPLPPRPLLSHQLKLWAGVLGCPLGIFLRQAFFIGERNDYVHLIIDSEAQLAAIKLWQRRLCLFSQRALIVTAPAKDSSTDYCLRYFAPQYGIAEDVATGSAHLQVAAYWQRRLVKREVVGRQLISGGGYFKAVACAAKQQKICGVAVVENN